jgi:uncharacterized 2Fe-2S/4Fe-4S cluster protein (DUF4445 family)
VREGKSLLAAAQAAGESIAQECGGRGVCGRCLVKIIAGSVPDYRVVREEDGQAQVLACLTPVRSDLVVAPLLPAQLPRWISHDRYAGVFPLQEWAPWELALDPLVACEGDEDLGAALDLGTTTLRLLLIRLADGQVVGEASAYNPQIPLGADVITRIVAAQQGRLDELSRSIRNAVGELLREAGSRPDDPRLRALALAGNLTMIHLLLGEDPSGIRAVPSAPAALSFTPLPAARLGWPARATIHIVSAVGGWVGGDILAGVVRSGFSRSAALALYVDLGTNGEIVVGGRDFALACACSAGPAFEGGGIRSGMRADRGAVDGVCVDKERETLELSVIGRQRPRGICGSGLIALIDALLRAGWIDRGGRFTDRLPSTLRETSSSGAALRLDQAARLTLLERDIASLIRAKAAVFAGMRSLVHSLGDDVRLERITVSGNFGRYLSLPAAVSIGLLPDAPQNHYEYVDNGSLEGAALMLLSRAFADEIERYRTQVTYVDLADLPGYMDEFVSASFLPHTDPPRLRI